MQAYNYSDEMAAIYRELLERWRASGGTLYNAFVDIAPPSQFGSWGALRHIDDATARWEALMAFNAGQPAWWEERRADAFVHGVTLIGGSGADLLQGTTEEDILIGGPGDDAFLALGRSDVLHGGPGLDVAVLPGALGDYTFAREGARLVAIRGSARTRLTAIERLQFDDTAIDTAGL
jgi:Ca2+-binding RTX toxin-like protein